MNDLKPCPFCGGKMDGYPDYTISFKRDRRKVHGIYFEVCTLHCNRCSCTIQQAGATREEAEKHAYNVWNERVTSAQPETHDKRTETHSCDLISREDAKWVVFCNRDHVEDQTNAIDSLTCVQPKRMKGRWIYGEHDIAMCDGYRCDKCGFFVPWDYKYTFIDFINDYHFCPNCGSDMRGEQNGENS